MNNAHESGVSWAFHIGPLGFSWYGIFVVAGFILSLIYSYIQWTKKGYSQWDFNNLFFLGSIATLWGARIWYIIFNPVVAFANVNDVLSALSAIIGIGAGRSIMGSIFFSVLLFYTYPKMFARKEIDWKITMDIFLPAMLLGQIIGRWGNFANHQVYGGIVSESELDWLPYFIKENMNIIGLDGISHYRSPIFLYESFANAISFLLIITMVKNNTKLKSGTSGASFLILYDLTRSIMECFRDPLYQMKWGSFHTSFWMAIIFFIAGILFFIEFQWNSLSKLWGIIFTLNIKEA